MGIILPDWKLYSLELDNDGRDMGNYFQSRGYGIERVRPIEGNESLILNFCVPPKTIENIISDSVDSKEKVLALSSHGNYHHLTYGLCKRADKLSEKYGYIHIDRHNDLFGAGDDKDAEEIHCGRFVRRLCHDTNVGKQGLRPDVLFIGTKVSLITGIMDPCAREFLFTGALDTSYSDLFYPVEAHLDRLPDDVYLTVDLDVLAPGEVRTAFDRGNMKAERLYEIVRMVKARKNIISADVVGYSNSDLPMSAYDCKKNQFGGIRDEEEPSFEKSMKVYENLVRIIKGGI
ncbi:MAG: arginase family protein [Nanoarchaeota archaeon]